jgi:hypothetical protein
MVLTNTSERPKRFIGVGEVLNNRQVRSQKQGVSRSDYFWLDTMLDAMLDVLLDVLPDALG